MKRFYSADGIGLLPILTASLLSMCFTVYSANATVTYNDGLVHQIDFLIQDNVVVSDSSSGFTTTLNIISGGAIHFDLWAYENSKVNLFSGSIGAAGRDVYIYNNSEFNMYGGSLGHELEVHDDSHVNISGGSIASEIHAHNNSIVKISGGAIGTSGKDTHAYNNSKIILTGGTLSRYLYAHNSSDIEISGGSIMYDLFATDDSQVFISGGWIGRTIYSQFDGHIAIYGIEFNYPDGYITDISGTLIGTLANEDPINVDFQREGNGAILLTHYNIADFNRDRIVNLVDYAILASYWLETDCGNYDDCESADFEPDGDVDIADLAKFMENWLKVNSP